VSESEDILMVTLPELGAAMSKSIDRFTPEQKAELRAILDAKLPSRGNDEEAS
jgi:hypothetical protein